MKQGDTGYFAWFPKGSVIPQVERATCHDASPKGRAGTWFTDESRERFYVNLRQGGWPVAETRRQALERLRFGVLGISLHRTFESDADTAAAIVQIQWKLDGHT